MASTARVTALLALLPMVGCSIDYDRFVGVRAQFDGGATDTGTTPSDAGSTPTDTPTTPTDSPVIPPRDGGMPPLLCHAPYLVAVTENLDNDASRLLRWSFADNRPCDDLPLTIPHPRAVGVAFDDISAVSGPHLIVVNDATVSMVDAETGATVRDVASDGPPRSVFDIVSNGSGTFAVAYSFTGDSPPGSVGTVRVFDHRSSLRLVQTWQRNMQFGLSVRSMTGFPGNQGQYLQLTTPDMGDGLSGVIASPTGMGVHPRSPIPQLANRLHAVAISAYRTIDRRGHYAVVQSGFGSTPVVSLVSSEPSASTVRDQFQPTVRCSEPCPSISRAVAFPAVSDAAAAICELSGTSFSVVRVGGESTNCHMLDTTALSGRWRINDLAVMPR